MKISLPLSFLLHFFSTGAEAITRTAEVVPAALSALDQDTCSCSPRDFTFKLHLDRDCDTNTISGSPGVGNAVAVCNVIGIGGAGDIDFSTLEIVEIKFFEFGSSLEVINQSIITSTSFVSGDTFTFTSISNMLSPDMSIEEQLQYYPTGVSLTMEGKAKDSDGNDVTVRNQVAWTYTESCDDLPISVGRAIGWLDVAVTEAPLPGFCSAVPPTTTTDAPTTDAPTTEATTPTTTTTEATTTTTTSTSHGMSVTTTAATFFGTGKSGKSGKTAKAKTLKAKVAKSADNGAKAGKVSKSGKSVKSAKLI